MTDLPTAKPLEELNDDERRLLDFTARFDRDPTGVALIFAGLALACAARDMPVWADEIITALEASGEGLEGPAIETLLALSPLVKSTTDIHADDADGDSPWRFYLYREERRELALVGAQRWIETQLNRTRFPPSPVCVSRDEIKAAVVDAPHATIDVLLRTLEGNGLAPRPVHRETVLEVLLEQAVARERTTSQLLGEVRGCCSIISAQFGVIDDAFQGHDLR